MDKNFIIQSDTDSLYIELKPVLDYMKSKGIEINDEDKNEFVLKIASKIQSKANDNLEDVCNELFNIPKNKYFQLKQEVIASTILATGKRRYGMWVTNKEGVTIPSDHKDALDLKGLEIMKSNMNPIFKKFGENFIKNILFNTPKHELDNSIIDFYNSLKQTDPRLLGKPTGVKQINSYRIPPTSGEIFSRFRLKAPSNTKAAVRYSDLLRFRKLDKKFETIIEGDKILIINLKQNPYQIDTIGLPNSKVPDEIDKFVKEYIDVDKIFESMLLNKLKELYLDLRWDFPNLNPNIGKFFSF
jgi:hypothetical protein